MKEVEDDHQFHLIDFTQLIPAMWTELVWKIWKMTIYSIFSIPFDHFGRAGGVDEADVGYDEVLEG